MNRFLLIGIIAALGTAPLLAIASAQSPSPPLASSQPLEQAPSDHPATPVPTVTSPRQYLDLAKQLLDAVSETSLDKDGDTRLSQLRRDYTQLMRNYQMRLSPSAGAAGSMSLSTNGVPQPAIVDWTLTFYDVERDFASLLGGGAPSPPITSATPVGMERPVLRAVTAPDIGAKNLSPDARGQLQDARTNVELFYDATSSTVMPGIGSGTR